MASTCVQAKPSVLSLNEKISPTQQQQQHAQQQQQQQQQQQHYYYRSTWVTR
jgi:hypothetical protein